MESEILRAVLIISFFAPSPLPAPSPRTSPTLTPLNRKALCQADGFQDVTQCIACTFLKLCPLSTCQATMVITTSKVGCIPSEIWPLTWLLSYRVTHWLVQYPSELGLMPLLEGLVLHNNQLTGTIPTEIGLMTALTYITLDNNQVGGRLLTEIGKLTNLEYLSLHKNKLTGTIPT